MDERRTMRIVHVVNSSRESMVGVESHILYLAAMQKARGSAVTIVTDYEGELASLCREHAIPTIIAEGLKAESGQLLNPSEKVIEDLISCFTDINAEVIHSHAIPVAVQAIPAGNRIGIPCVITFNAAGPLLAARRAGLKFVTICVIKERFEHLRNSGIPEREIFYIPNGTKAVTLPSPEEKHRPRRPNLAVVGSLIARKGVDNAILAMAELRRRLGPGCPALTVYGDGALKEYLLEMVSVLRLDDIVRFCGYRPNAMEHCASTDILVMPSRSETGPLVVLEAMSRGMPIVATDVGEVAEMLPDQRYGRVVSVDSIVALADAIESLLSDIISANFDPQLLIQRHRSLYSDEKMAERIEAIYEKAALIGSALA
jgi:glycosyltransferase involved in cell wall biosynthesis